MVKLMTNPVFKSNSQAAIFWYNYGFKVIPLVPEQKRPAVTYCPWLDELSLDTVRHYWSENPTYGVGCVLPEDVVVFDTDTPEAEAALRAIKKTHGIYPLLITCTQRGYHHFFRITPGTCVKSDSHGTAEHPERIDVKANRSQVVLPSEPPRKIRRFFAKSLSALTAVDQAFVDDVFSHNGRPLPRPQAERDIGPPVQSAEHLRHLGALLEHIDPDSGYEDWLHVLMALCHETNGSDEGLELADSWSSKGSKYNGRMEIEEKWRSFARENVNPITIASLIAQAREAGAEIDDIMTDPFETCDFETLEPSGTAALGPVNDNPLARFSLRGMHSELAEHAKETTPLLGEIALKGQATVIYAAPNTGKTLLTLHLLADAIALGRVDPAHVYYFNFDDTFNGLLDKLKIAETLGFHMLSEGFGSAEKFKVRAFFSVMREVIDSNQSGATVLILDTLTKFANLMDKTATSQFTALMREFIMKGGSLIALAHINKHLQDGQPVPSGTSDILDDLDCVYVLQTIANDPDTGRRVVEFTNRKLRGNVAQSAAYSYSLQRDLSYADLLSSVQEVDRVSMEPIKRSAQLHADAEVVHAIEACIKDGIDKRMDIKRAVAKRCRTSERSVLTVLDEYTGTDAEVHRWDYDVQDRGAKVYRLLERQKKAQAVS